MTSKYYVSGSKDSDYYNPLLDKDYYDKVDEIEEKEKIEEKEIIYKEKKKVFNNWYIVSLIGNTLQIFAAGMSIVDSDNVSIITEALVGFSCVFAYINMLRYLEYNIQYSVITKSIRKGLPVMLKYLFGMLPIFLGFALLGVCIFWRSERFVNLSTAMFTLFAFLNGDSVFTICYDLREVSFFVGQLYCYLYGVLFTVYLIE